MIAGISEEVTPIDMVIGTAHDIPVVDANTTLTFSGRSTAAPALMESDTAGY